MHASKKNITLPIALSAALGLSLLAFGLGRNTASSPPASMGTNDAAQTGNFQDAQIPLSQLSNIESTEGPVQISRENGQRRVVIQSNVRGRDLGGFVDEARARIESNCAANNG